MSDKPACGCHHAQAGDTVELAAEYTCTGCGRVFGLVDAVPVSELEELVERMEAPETFVSDHVGDKYIEGYNQADNDRAKELQEIIENYE